MTESEHVYTASISGQPERELSLRGGRITLDAGAAPHVSATLELAMPDAATLAALDPRTSPRVVVQADAVTPTGTQSRTFDLGLRDRDVRHRDGIVSVSLASDEAILTDYAPLLDDPAPFTLASSLRAIVDYVLGQAIPGAELEASPSADADLTPYWAVTNLVPNPAVRALVGNWIAGGQNGNLVRETGLTGSPVPGVSTDTLTTWSGPSGAGQGGAYANSTTVVPYIVVRPFTEYTVQLWVYSNAAKSLDIKAQIFGEDGAVLNQGALLRTVQVPANTWTLISGTLTTPANAARLGPFVYAAAATQWAAGNSLRTLGWMVYEGSYPVPLDYFDGASINDEHYRYAPSGEPHASASTRDPYPVERDPDSVIWKAGETALEFLAPLVQAAGYRLVCDEARRWTLRSENYTAPGALTIRHAVNLADGADSIARDSGIWFDAAVTTYSWTDGNGVQQLRVDSFALTEPYTRLKRYDKDTPYPGPGFSEYAVRRAQGRGRQVSATSVTDWTARAEQPVTVVLQGAPTQLGTTQRVDIDLNGDGMTITTRSTDTPAGAINLLTGTIDELTGTIDQLGGSRG